MKKIQILLACALIIGTTQLSAMKRDQSQITPAPEATQEIWLPSEVITKIAATCNSATRTNLSLANKYFNACASIKNNDAIMNQPEFEIETENRLYYLFYGCLHNFKNLVSNALQKFDAESYSDRRILNHTKYFIQKLTHNDATELLSHYSDITIDQETTALHWVINEEHKTSISKLLIQLPAIDINAQNNTKDTPLHIAIRNHNAETVKLLLADSNIKLDIPNDDKHVALDLARSVQRQLALTYSNLADQEQIGRSWARKVIKHIKKAARNTTIIGLLMQAYGWDA